MLLAERRSRQELRSKGATSKNCSAAYLRSRARHSAYKRIRAPCDNSSAPTLPKPCPHAGDLTQKIPSISSFPRDNCPHFPLKPTSFFLVITRVFHLDTGSYPLLLDYEGKTLPSETSHAYSRRNRVWRYNDIAHVTATTSGIALQQFLKIIGGKSPNSQNMRMFMRAIDDGRRDA
mgnify:CR=1 FL=1